jgi:hypothetical protein
MLPQALQDLSLDYVDTLLVHWPSAHPGGAAVGDSSDAACNTSATRCSSRVTRCFFVTFSQLQRDAVPSEHVERHAGNISIGAGACSRRVQLQRDASPRDNGCRATAAVGQPVSLQRVQGGQPDEHAGVLPPSRHSLHGVQVPPRPILQPNIPTSPSRCSPLGVPDVHQFPASHGLAPTLLQDPTVRPFPAIFLLFRAVFLFFPAFAPAFHPFAALPHSSRRDSLFSGHPHRLISQRNR